MTQVQMGDEVIETDLPAEAVADLQQPVAQPQAQEPEKATEQPVEAPKEPEKPAEVKAEEQPQANPEVVRQKPTPIQNLLAKKHEAEERAAQAEAEAAELRAKLAQAAVPSVASSDDVKSIAEEYGLDETLVSKLVNAARSNVELPKEVQQLLQEREQEKQTRAEMQAFESRVSKLTQVFKDEPIAQHKDKLLQLAYSTDKAPDGEPYYQKELSELYFAFVKPEIEPAKPSAESSRGGIQTTQVMDFQEIFERDNPKDVEDMDSATFQAYSKWLNANGPQEKITRKTI